MARETSRANRCPRRPACRTSGGRRQTPTQPQTNADEPGALQAAVCRRMTLTRAMLDAAATALAAALPFTRPADGVLRDFFRANSKLGSRDRAFVAETVFGILRRLSLTQHLAGGAQPRAMLLAYLVRLGGISLRELAPLLSEEETRWLRQVNALELAGRPLVLRADFPPWL